MHYKIKLSEKSKRDFRRISNYIEEYRLGKVYKQIKIDIENLKFMPRRNKTLYSSKEPNGEYRRLISGKYIIIYQIYKDQITILRVFNQKENYLNLNKFILREKSQKYYLIKYKTKV